MSVFVKNRICIVSFLAVKVVTISIVFQCILLADNQPPNAPTNLMIEILQSKDSSCTGVYMPIVDAITGDVIDQGLELGLQIGLYESGDWSIPKIGLDGEAHIEVLEGPIIRVSTHPVTKYKVNGSNGEPSEKDDRYWFYIGFNRFLTRTGNCNEDSNTKYNFNLADYSQIKFKGQFRLIPMDDSDFDVYPPARTTVVGGHLAYNWLINENPGHSVIATNDGAYFIDFQEIQNDFVSDSLFVPDNGRWINMYWNNWWKDTNIVGKPDPTMYNNWITFEHDIKQGSGDGIEFITDHLSEIDKELVVASETLKNIFVGPEIYVGERVTFEIKNLVLEVIQ